MEDIRKKLPAQLQQPGTAQILQKLRNSQTQPVLHKWF